jgi:hypothetical protein
MTWRSSHRWAKSDYEGACRKWRFCKLNVIVRHTALAASTAWQASCGLCCVALQVMIGASEVGTVQPLVKEGQTVNKVRGARTLWFVNTAALVLPMCVRSQLNLVLGQNDTTTLLSHQHGKTHIPRG